MPTKVILQGYMVLALLGMTWTAVQGKVLGVFGDSLSDNGNGCNNVVKNGFAGLGYDRALLPNFPPAPQYWKGRYSDGPVWPDYLADLLTGYELHDVAVGGASTMPATYKVSSYYPDNLKDNGLGLVSFPRPGFHDQIVTLLGQTGGQLTADDVMLVAIGNNNFGDARDLNSAFHFAQNGTFDTPTNVTLEIYSTDLGLGLDELYAAGGRKFMVASIAAAYLVPQAIHAAQEVAALNPAYSGINNPVTQYLIALTDAAVAAAQYEATAFAARYPADPPNVQFISFADVQKAIVANATQLGFIDTTMPCTLDALKATYATSNEYEMGTLVTTHPGAVASLARDLGVSSLPNATHYAYNALMGPVVRSKPNDTASFLAAWSAHVQSTAQNATTDRVRRLQGVVYTDLPKRLGGLNPWDFVPTCIKRAAEHMWHDDVHPTTKQHKLIGQVVYDTFNGVLF